LNLLLDTHVWLWWLQEDPQLPARFLEAVNSPDNRVFVSAISLWELNIKRQSGKLRVDGDLAKVSLERGLQFMAFTVDHADLVLTLPDFHKDPFDRALIAQAIGYEATMLTCDATIQRYPGLRLL
jgi:PIN domain nuclease of toxin-antitoxin system